MRKIELLSPAKDAECGIEAIRHGADAVYIGGPNFGARAAAANSIADISRLCDYAHLFEAKVYVALNTILWDSELTEVEKIVHALYQAGTDALIVQDTALLKLDLPPIPLHASTQMDNRTPEKAKMLEHAGFSQIVLARELPLDAIKEIHSAVNVPLEAFVHGALCVSYSGQCYASEHCFGRSANRGCCAQFCRLPFDLIDANGEVLVKDRHLLSLRDMNRSESLEEMMDAGISSFKIEGRLKGLSYVKNVTACYRKKLDEILERRSNDYIRSSYGTTTYQFTPNINKSFNRGYTDYFLHNHRTAIHNFNTPKAMGEHIGTVSYADTRRSLLRTDLSGDGELAAGDGLCFIDTAGKLQGFRVNKAEPPLDAPGKRSGKPQRAQTVYLNNMPPLHKGATLFRNLDFQFDKAMSKPTAERSLAISIILKENSDGYTLIFTDETDISYTLTISIAHEEANTPQAENIRRQLSKLGNTPYYAKDISLQLSGNRFIPSSKLAEWRRTCVEQLTAIRQKAYRREVRKTSFPPKNIASGLPEHLDYSYNISNKAARNYYEELGAKTTDLAYELSPPPEALLMTCKYCLRYALKACPKTHHPQLPFREPLMLRAGNGRLFRLSFDCKNCQMKIYATK